MLPLSYPSVAALLPVLLPLKRLTYNDVTDVATLGNAISDPGGDEGSIPFTRSIISPCLPRKCNFPSRPGGTTVLWSHGPSVRDDKNLDSIHRQARVAAA